VAQAAPPRQDAPTEGDSDECIGCHEGLRDYWEHGAHSQALSDPVFQAAWQEQGQPAECLACHTSGYDAATGEYLAEGVDCVACHYPVMDDHPDNYMPTDVSSRLCGSCHTETFSEWQDSHHASEDMACSQCHNPHTADLRVESAQALCQQCHQDQSHFFSFTGHAKEGLLCTDCHLTVEDGALGEGHGSRSHSFKVDLQTCNQCHEGDMHAALEQEAGLAPSKDVACYRTDMVRATVAPEQPVEAEPQQANPLVYFLPAAIGLMFGVVIAPFAENLYRRRREDK